MLNSNKSLTATFLILFVLLNFFFSNAQQNDSLVNTAIEHGKQKFFYREFDKSILLFEKSLEYYKSTNNGSKMAQCYNLLSRAHISNMDLENAPIYANKALEFSRQNDVKNKLEEANALDNIASIHRLKRNYDEALKNHDLALKIRLEHFKNDDYNLADSYYSLGKTYHRQGNYKSAIENLNLSLNSIINESPKSKILEANINETFGQINYDRGELDKSFTNFQSMYKLSKEVYEESNPYFIEVYNQLALIYNQKKEYSEGQKYLQKALSLSIALYGVDKTPSQVRIHHNLGTAYFDGGLKEKGLFHTKKALEMGIKIFGEDDPNLHFPYSQIGRIYGDQQGIPYIEKALEILNKNDNPRHKIIASFCNTYLASIYFNLEKYSKALEYTKKSLDTRLELFGKNNFNTIESQIDISKILLKLNDYDNALEYNNEALIANDLRSFNQQIANESLQPVDYLDNKLQIDATKTKADILLALYHKTKNKAYLLESNTFYKNAESLISSLRNTKRNYDDKIKFSSIVKSIYAKIVETKLLIHQLDSTLISLDSTFYFSEKSKANVIRELAKNTQVKKLSNVSSEILVLEKDIDSEIAKLTSNIIQEVSSEVKDTIKIYALEGRLFDLTKRKDSLESQIEKDFPKYYDLKYEKHVIDIKQLQKKLNQNTTFIEFLKSDNIIYTYIITKNNFSVEQLEVKDLNSTIETLNSSISNKETTTYIETSKKLYNQLIKPIRKHFVGNRLIIVPDETLWHLQFDLLINSENNTSNNTPNYLLLDYAISYANSASMLFENNQDNSSQNLLNECLAFSYTNNDSILKNSGVDLPGSREEIKALSNVFKGKYLYNEQASESNFKTYVNSYKLVHLALHAEIDSLNPEIIKIRFSESSKNEKEDNILYGHELYTVNIPADLVVLSACNTGVGKINKGEGILSIGNAFQYAGAESLMLSRWEISDETTAKVMNYFYKNIKGGMNKSEALQQAKIEYLNTTDMFTSAPYYWGSFYILGDTGKINLENNSPTMYTYIFGFIILILISIIAFRKKK